MTQNQNDSDNIVPASVGPWSQWEELIAAFEHAWRVGSPPNIDDFLRRAGSNQHSLLVELVHADLEFRIKAGEVARAESYLERYPRLNLDNATVLDLLKAECELRQRKGAEIDCDEYARRFPTHAEELRRILAGAATLPDRREILAGVVGESELPVVPGYEILEQIGRGGMGVVYRARQLDLNRIVALKMILNGFEAGPKDLARFRAEAAALARLRHPHIVQIYDFGEAGGRPYFAFEFVAGGSLSDLLQGQPQPAGPAAQLVATLARAVHAAHANGVIHRDLKPANILLRDETGDYSPYASRLASLVPMITDFGLAKCVGGDEGGTGKGGHTVTGELLGTPSYMAPEQATVPRHPVGPPADVYALGAILYELLTGRPPFKGGTPLATILQVLHNEPVSVTSLQPQVAQDLETICQKCLRKEPQKRYSSALELAEDVQRFLKDEPILARPVWPVEKVWRWMRRNPVPAGLIAAGLLAPVVALVALSFLSARLVRSIARESAAQQAELLEEATREYSRNVQRVIQAKYPVNKSVPPTPNTVPLSIPATFLHDVGQQLSQNSKTGVKVRQYSDYPFPWRKDGGPRDDFEREALRRLRESNGEETYYEFTEFEGQRVVRYAQARIMQKACVECHSTHPQTPRKDWKVGDVRGVLEIIRPLDRDEARVGEAVRLALFLSAVVSGLLLGGSMLVVAVGRRRTTVRN